MQIRNGIILLACAIALSSSVLTSMAAPATAQAATDEASPNTFYVRPDGNDGTDGRTVATAWRTLGHALSRVGPGQTLYVLNGSYYQPRCSHCGAHFRLARSGRADAWIRVLAYPGHQPEIRADRGTGIELVGSFIELSGFRIRGEGFSPSNNWGAGIMFEGGHSFRLTNNVVSGFPKSGIGGIRVSGVTIEGNVVFDNAWWSPDADSGISLLYLTNRGAPAGPDGYHDRVAGNTVFRNENRAATPQYAPPGMVSDGNGIIIDSGQSTGYSGRVLVMHNLAVNNGGKGINVHQTNNVDVVHNTLFHNGFSANMHGANGDVSVVRSNNVRVINNAVQARGDRVSYLNHQSNNVSAAGNVFSGGTTHGPLDRNANLVTPTAVSFVRPGLDPLASDFRLNADSIASNRGTAVGLPSSGDRDGRPRPVGAGPDAGAYERQSSSAAPAAPAPGDGSQLVIRARGDMGDEAMHLAIDGHVVGTWTVARRWAEYRAAVPAGTSIRQVQIRFTNDLHRPPVDRNLEVDWVRVGATAYHSNEPAVTSIGPWTGASCRVPGHHQARKLHCNGHFDFSGVAPR
jgi:hypothetical protein